MTFMSRIEFYKEKYFFWYVLDTLLLGFVLGLVGNIANDGKAFDNFLFFLLGIITRFLIVAYQYSRSKKDFSKSRPLFIIIMAVIIMLNFLSIYLNSQNFIFQSIICLIICYIISYALYLIVRKYDQFKFILGYAMRIWVFFSGIFFDPVKYYQEYFFAEIFYLNPGYIVYTILNFN